MLKNNHLSYYCLAALFLLAGCSSAPKPESNAGTLEHQKHGDYQITNLPLSQNWRSFQCREGGLEARYSDGSQKKVALRLGRGSEFTLTRRPSYDPAIFENERIALYINEREAVVGRPASSMLMLTGCQAR